MTVKIDAELAVRLLDRAVSEKGADYKYEMPDGRSCMYEQDGAPSCLVGHALHYVGVSTNDLRKLDNLDDEEDADGNPLVGGTDIAAVAPYIPGVEITDDALTVLAHVQFAQDTGSYWGVAVDKARTFIKIP